LITALGANRAANRPERRVVNGSKITVTLEKSTRNLLVKKVCARPITSFADGQRTWAPKKMARQSQTCDVSVEPWWVDRTADRPDIHRASCTVRENYLDNFDSQTGARRYRPGAQPWYWRWWVSWPFSLPL